MNIIVSVGVQFMLKDKNNMPQYDIGTALIKMITPRVKKAYPELWRKETDANGDVCQFKPNNETILESAMSMDIDDKIDELLEDHRGEVLERLHVVFPEETKTHYVAGVFLTNLGWKKA